MSNKWTYINKGREHEVEIHTVDNRGYYIAIRKSKGDEYLYKDSKIHSTASHGKRLDCFWKTKEEAINFYKKWAGLIKEVPKRTERCIWY